MPIAPDDVGWMARFEAISMLPRASSSSGWATACSRLSRISRSAWSAYAEACGFHSEDTWPSMA